MQEDRKGAAFKAIFYSLLNTVVGVGIVFANKSVFSVYGFRFTCALTWIHTLFTIVGMWMMRKMGFFHRKRVPPLDLVPLSLAYVGYIVLGNWNLNINSVGFYQVCKIAVAPTVLIVETLWYGKHSTTRVKLSVAIVCVGVGAATVSEVGATPFGILIGLLSILATGLYQIWAGVEQKKRGLGSMQLLNEFSPVSLVLLTILTPFLENVGGPSDKTSLLGFTYTREAVAAIVISSVLGIFVSLSTFLVIGATSSLTYNIVGHVKTVLILTGGYIFFGDTMSTKKVAGIAVAFVGIVWYSQLKLEESRRAVKKMSSTGKILVDADGTSGASVMNMNLVRRF